MIGVRSGWVFASANSDLFTFVQEHLTVDRKDFNAPAIGVDVEIAVTPRVSAVGGFDYARATKNSDTAISSTTSGCPSRRPRS